MATLIPSLSTCVRRMTPGERRFAERLEAKLEDDYCCWYDVPIGSANVHPDFVVLHPRRGLLVLEVKDWKTETIARADKMQFTLRLPEGEKKKANPLEQACQHARAIMRVLGRDPQLIHSDGSYQGHSIFPWSYGVVLTNITRRQFEQGELEHVIDPNRAICKDEMEESVDPLAFQERLWQMFHIRFESALTLPQIDRIRWHMFPEIRISNRQAELYSDEPKDLVAVMDLQQEQLARSLGEGHRVIHGVAGSGKTLILGYRAEYLAKACVKPILVLCYNRSLAKRLAWTIEKKGLVEKVRVHTFHQWCSDQLRAFNAGVPPPNADKNAYSAALVENVIRAVDRGLIPGGQYEAVLIDEGHDFEPQWLKLVVQMVDPKTNSLLVLYDDAQALYSIGKSRPKFSFKSVGVQAAGRTTILKVNYRNTQEILSVASSAASELLTPKGADDDGVPRIAPIGAGRHGPEPLIVKLPTIKEESAFIVEKLKAAHKSGLAWRDMAVVDHDYGEIGKPVLAAIRRNGIPVTWYKDATFRDNEDTVKFLSAFSAKGLEFPLVAIPGTKLLGLDPARRELESRLLYVAMTRATQHLIVLK